LPNFKTLAIQYAARTVSPEAYFDQLNMSKHCFAICVLFVLNKLTSHYMNIESIQQRHTALSLNDHHELSKEDLAYFKINEVKSQRLSVAEFQKKPTLLEHKTPTLIVFTASTHKRHSIAIRNNNHNDQLLLLNTSGQSGIPRTQPLHTDKLGLYIQSLIESNEAIGNPIQHIQCIRYESCV